MKAKLCILICFLLAGQIAYPQAIYTMPVTGTQTDTVCGGMFYDSGGPVGNYSNNGNGILVFCPAIPGQFVMLSFTSINLADAGDRLRIFSGTDTLGIPSFNVAGPTTSAGCGAVVISNDSSSGCLTVHFRSDAVINASGWRAILYCNPTMSVIPPGTNCANPVSISSIPFIHTGQCTECMINDYQTQSGICNTTYAGEDRVYQYTTTGPETVCITMSNTTGSSTLAIYQGCPGTTAVVCLTPTPMVGNDSMQFTFPAAGTYYIIIDEPTNYSCYDLSITPCNVGIDEQENPADGVLIFPNPITNEFTIYGLHFTIVNIEIYNMLEEKVYSRQLETSNQEPVTVNVSDLPRGIYFVTIAIGDNNSITRKIVKM